MHVLVGLVDLRGVRLGSESCETLLEDVDSHRLVGGDKHIDTQIELVPIDEQRIGHVPRNNGQLVHIDIVYVVDELDASALGSISWFDDPDVLLRVVLLELLVVLVELPKLIWQDVGVRHEVKVLLAVPLLHPDHIEA